MNRRVLFLAAAAPLVFAALSHADDGVKSDVEQPAASADSAPEAKAEAKTAAQPEAKPEAKPEARPEAKSETKPAQVPAAPAPAPAPEKKTAPEAKPKEKSLNSSAAQFEPVADSYQSAHDGLLAWLRAASETMDVVDGKVAALKKLIAEKEARITQFKLEASAKNEAEARDLDRETRTLWAQLKAEEARRLALGRALSAAVGKKVRDLNRSVLEKFELSAQTQ